MSDSVDKLGGLAGTVHKMLISGTKPDWSATPTVTTIKATTFDTNVAAAAVTLSGTTVTALGSDTDINVTITPKGAGTIVSAAVYAKAVGATTRYMLVDNSGLIGNATSSRKFKENIKTLDDSSQSILSLRPVSFNYKNDDLLRKKTGLIAEEVAEILPELVSYDEHSEPHTVSYHELPTLILYELMKLDKLIEFASKKTEKLESLFSSC